MGLVKLETDIEFWKDSTRDVVQELYDMLLIDIGMSKQQATEYVERIYYAISSEFGE